LAEAGAPDYDMSAWFGLFAPGGTPKPLVDDLTTISMRFKNARDETEIA